MKYDAVLENWYTDPHYRIIWGCIQNDIKGRFYDGQRIHTSSIPDWKPDTYKKGMIVQTLNTKYLLGKPLNTEST